MSGLRFRLAPGTLRHAIADAIETSAAFNESPDDTVQRVELAVRALVRSAVECWLDYEATDEGIATKPAEDLLDWMRLDLDDALEGWLR
jgi:hypothetical protein